MTNSERDLALVRAALEVARIKCIETMKGYRLDKHIHLGLGDIRLTIGAQEEIANAIRGASVAVVSPQPDERDAEIKRLRQRVAELEAALRDILEGPGVNSVMSREWQDELWAKLGQAKEERNAELEGNVEEKRRDQKLREKGIKPATKPHWDE